MILVDFSGVAIASMNYDEFENANLDFIRHKVINSLRYISMKFKKDYKEIVICLDSSNSWRKEIYPYYKANRKKSRETITVDWDKIYKYISIISQELSESCIYKTVKVDRAEADDIIAVLSKNIDENVLIYSADKDFIQLLKHENVKLFNPRKDEFVTHMNPDYFLFEHICRGDAGDGVVNILSQPSVLMDSNARQKPVFTKKVETWYYDRSLIPDKERFAVNETVISLDMIPEDMTHNILKAYTDAKTVNKQAFMVYLIKNNLHELTSRLQDF